MTSPVTDKRIVETLKALVELIQRSDASQGYCCCGDDMKTHPSEMMCGHEAVDYGVYTSICFQKDAKDLIADIEAKNTSVEQPLQIVNPAPNAAPGLPIGTTKTVTIKSQDKDMRNCPECSNSDSWGLPTKTGYPCNSCFPNPQGGTRFIPLNFRRSR